MQQVYCPIDSCEQNCSDSDEADGQNRNAGSGEGCKGNTKIEFTATGTSEAGNKLYAWDFRDDEEQEFKSSVLIDKSGHAAHTFSAGVYTIAVKIVDNEGHESIETIKLKVNGAVEKL